MCSSAPMLLNTLTITPPLRATVWDFCVSSDKRGWYWLKRAHQLALRPSSSWGGVTLVSLEFLSRHDMSHYTECTVLSDPFFFSSSLSVLCSKNRAGASDVGGKKKRRWFDAYGVEAASFCLHVLDFYKPEQCRNIRNHSRVITWDKYDLIHCCVVLIRSVIG